MFLFHWQKKVKFSNERRLFVFWPKEVIDFLPSVGFLKVINFGRMYVSNQLAKGGKVFGRKEAFCLLDKRGY